MKLICATGSNNLIPAAEKLFRTINSRFRILLALIVCFVVTSCAHEAGQIVSTPVQTLPVTIDPVIEIETTDNQPVEAEPIEVELVAEEPEEPARIPVWDYVAASSVDPLTRNSNLLIAANSLVNENRIEEARAMLELINTKVLTPVEKIDHSILIARLLQAIDEHKKSLRVLRSLEKSVFLDSAQRIRLIRLITYSNIQLGEVVQVAFDLVKHYSLLPPGSETVETGHMLWNVLRRIPFDDLTAALSKKNDPIANSWITLALAANSVVHDPFQYRNALEIWLEENPDHPARDLLNAGLIPGAPIAQSPIERIAVIVPLSSSNKDAAQAFLDGLKAQHAADSNPDKPYLQVFDAGSDPGIVIDHYYTALDLGADFVIGPLGVDYVKELVEFGEFVVPTLLLGDVGEIELPEYVYQFSLAPEQDGINAARQARQDGHSTALALYPPTRWGTRAFEAFKAEWNQLGGAVVQSQQYDLNQVDYSESVKDILNIESSVKRYVEVRALLDQGMIFFPRRRQDADFIFMTADPVHGRLIKPHIDFLKAHDLPVYSTSRIFAGELNQLDDQDLNGIRFADMNWLIDRSDTMSILRREFETPWSGTNELDRIFAMGVDTYNLVFRIDILRNLPHARHHGVTAILHMDRQGRILRSPIWAKFVEGIPQLIAGQPDPEKITAPVRYVSHQPPLPAER